MNDEFEPGDKIVTTVPSDPNEFRLVAYEGGYHGEVISGPDNIGDYQVYLYDNGHRVHQHVKPNEIEKVN